MIRRHILLEVREEAGERLDVTAFCIDPVDEGREVLEVVELQAYPAGATPAWAQVIVPVGRAALTHKCEHAGVVDPVRASEPSYATHVSDVLRRLAQWFDEVL